MSGASGIHRLALFSHPANLVMKGLMHKKKKKKIYIYIYILDVLVRSMFQDSQYLKSLSE